jgi:predicted HAD superfamily Cof-like phosphohydrolase
MMRSRTAMDMVREFHVRMALPLDQVVFLPNGEFAALRRKLLLEEAFEVEDARKPADVLKELADVVYTAYGYAATYGWNLDAAIVRVHDSNMSKLQDDGTPLHRADGKVMKGPNYKPPTMKGLYEHT